MSTAPRQFPGDLLSAQALDNPVWTSLDGPHAHLAVRVGQAARYPADVAPFAALSTGADDRGWDDLRELAGPGGVVTLTGSSLQPRADWTVLMSAEGVQLVSTDALDSRPYDEAVVLTAADAQDMLDLVALTKPGPFQARTYLLGRYLGVRHEGRLVALAGERLHPPGFTEISAVCTHPEFRGRGYGTRLVQAVAHGVRERGEVPMLHAAASNTQAIRLYEAIGFSLRKSTVFMSVRAPA